MNIICIIPARGGSKRIKNKNLVDLGGCPLILWTINDAKKSMLIDRIIVSTDSEDIKEIAIENGVEVIDRPASLSGDTIQVEDAIIHVLNSINEKIDFVVLLQCTTPFRTDGDIDKGIVKIIQDGADSLFFATISDQFIWTKDNRCINYDPNDRPRTQDKYWEIVELGNYITKPSVYYKKRNRIGGKITHLLVDKISEIDIDNEFDLMMARGLVEELNLRC